MVGEGRPSPARRGDGGFGEGGFSGGVGGAVGSFGALGVEAVDGGEAAQGVGVHTYLSRFWLRPGYRKSDNRE